MKKVVIFEDGKGLRGKKAKLLKRGNKRVLIEFEKYDYENDTEVVVREWFKLFIPSYVKDKKSHKHNNKRKFAYFCHEETNMFYSDYHQTEEYKVSAKEDFSPSYYESIFG